MSNGCAKIGIYPKSYIKSDLAKIIHDRLIEMSGNCSKVNRILNFYDLIFSLQIQVENNKLSKYNKQVIKSFKNVDNLLTYYFTNIRHLMMEIKMRDDIVISNDHMCKTHHNLIRRAIKFNNIEL